MINKKDLLAIGLMAFTPLFVACGDDSGADDGGGCSGHEICPPDAGPSFDADVNAVETRTSIFYDAIDEAHDEIPGSSVTLVQDPVAQEITAKDWVAKGLVPGDVVTVWWVFFTDQTDCTAGSAGAKCGAPDLQVASTIPGFGYAGPAPMGGAIVDANGDATFPALTTPVVDEAAVNADFLIGNGLRDLKSTEIHVVLRTHGQALADDALLESQLGTFNGGCLDGEPNMGDCANVQFAYFNPLP